MNYQGIDNVQQCITERVSNGHWSIMGVGASEGTPTFSYTVGLHHKNLPEFIVFGMNPYIAAQILNICAGLAIEKGRYKHGQIESGAANYAITIINASQSAKTEYAIQAYNHYKHWEFELQQLILTDKSGNFPWDTEYDTGTMSGQPIIGHPPHEKMI